MNKEMILDELRKHIGEVLPTLDAGSVRLNDRLADLGANSIDRMEIITLSLEGLDLNVPLHEVARSEEIGELVDLLYRKACA